MDREGLEPFRLFENMSGGWSLMLTDPYFGDVVGVFEQANSAGADGVAFEGDGFDWAAVCTAMVRRDAPHLAARFRTDPGAGLFVAYGPDRCAIEELGSRLAAVYRDHDLLAGLLASLSVRG